MSASELEVQPAHIDEEPLTQDALYEEPPKTKSKVHLNKTLALQNARFKKGDWVHMSLIENGARVKGVYSIWAVQYNDRGWVDYQLLDMHDQLYNRGTWTRESLLKGGK